MEPECLAVIGRRSSASRPDYGATVATIHAIVSGACQDLKPLLSVDSVHAPARSCKYIQASWVNEVGEVAHPPSKLYHSTVRPRRLR